MHQLSSQCQFESQSEASVPPEASVLCCYYNGSPKVQVIRGSQRPGWHLERVVFPGQRLLFEAPRQARVEVYTGAPVGALLADTIACDRMRVSIPD